MTSRTQALYYAMLRHPIERDTSEHIIDQAIDRLSFVKNELSEIPTRVRAASLIHIVQVFKCQASFEVQQRLLEAQSSTTAIVQSDHEKADSLALLARALEASAVCYAMQHFMKEHSTAFNTREKHVHSLNHLLQRKGDKVLGSVASSIDHFREQYIEKTLEIQATLVFLMHLRHTQPSMYRAFSKIKGERCANGQLMSRFRTVSMSLDPSSGSKSGPTRFALQGRRAFSMEVHAGRHAARHDAQLNT